MIPYSKIISIFIVSIFFSCTNTKEIQKPNIIYILADDLGYGDVSCFNENSKIQTPNLDQLAAEGLMFTDAHTSSSVCTPTRYGILTGRYNWRTHLKQGVLSGYSKSLIKSDRTTVADLLKDNGYHTAFIGKWHLGWDWVFSDTGAVDIDKLKAMPEVDFTKKIKHGPSSHGFEYSYGFCGSLDMPPYVWVENDMPTMVPNKMTKGKAGQSTWRKGPTSDDFDHAKVLPELTEKTITYIGEHANQDKPFFVYMPLPAPHTPILPTEEFQGKSGLDNPYGDFVLMVDWVVGEITKALEACGMEENTLIVFTSDNGCSPTANIKQLKSKGHSPNYIFRGTKADIFEGGHRVPYIIKWKGHVKTGKSAQLVCTTDFFATVANLLGVTYDDHIAEDSYSHLGATGMPSTAAVRPSIIHHSVRGNFAYRKGDWKLIFCPGSGGWSQPNVNSKDIMDLPKFQLYNLKSDSGEENNLESKYPELVEEYGNDLLRIIEKGRSTKGKKQGNDGEEGWWQWKEIQKMKRAVETDAHTGE